MRWIPTLLLSLPALGQEPSYVLRERINQAIDRGVDWLLEHEERGALRFQPGDDGHLTLALYTLLKSGVRHDHPLVLDAFERLRRLGGTYQAACLLLALTTGRPEGWREWMQDVVDEMVRWQGRAGAWGYPTGEDLSNTQYAALGLYAAARAGARVPMETWEELADAVHDYRVRDGGYPYRRGGHSYGSMTAAGVGTLAICRDRLSYGGDLSRELAAVLDEDVRTGLEWLARHFSVTENPLGANWHYYYLYGLERVGALCAVDRIGAHAWYVEGAEFLVEEQGADGSWNEENRALSSTCFALLFLHRATARLYPLKGPPTVSVEVYGRDDPGQDVSLRASGDTPLELWISRFGRDVLQELSWPGEAGLRVAKVEYRSDGEPIGVVHGQLARPSVDEHFQLEHSFPEPGDYRIEAVVDVLGPPRLAADGEALTRVVQLRSAPFRVAIRAVDPPWMVALKELMAADVLQRQELDVRASSVFKGYDPWSGEHVVSDGQRAVDGDAGTGWWARPDDDEPWLRIVVRPVVQADTVVLCHARARMAEPSDFARAARVQLIVNRKERFDVHPGPGVRSPTVFELPARTEIRSLELRVLSRTRGERIDGVGFNEVLLLDRGAAGH